MQIDLPSAILNETTLNRIVYVQLALFFVWLGYLIYAWVRQGILYRRVYNAKSPTDLVSDKGRGPKSIVSNHVKSIRDLGIRDNDIDLVALNRSTIDRINIGDSILKSSLSLFLIVGLLGTLVGLAVSLADFSSKLPAGEDVTSKAIQEGLQNLLVGLRGAFLPSVIGVTTTILGVLAYALFQRTTALPLSNLIEERTLTDWGPQFIRTPLAKEQDRLLDLQELIEKSVEISKDNERAAKNFQEVTDVLKGEAGGLATNIKSAGKTLRILSESSQNLKQFADKFVESVTQITSFQDDLRNIYEQNAGDSRVFRETIESVLSENRAFQDRIETQFANQYKETKELFIQLKSYEDAYVKSRESIDENLNKLLRTADFTYNKLGSQNEELLAAIRTGLAEEVGKPITTKLDEKLERTSEVMADKLKEVADEYAKSVEQNKNVATELGTIKTSLDSIQKPLDSAAIAIKGIASDFDKRTESLLKELQTEFIRQGNITQSQLDNLTGLKEGVTALSGRLSSLTAEITAFNVKADELRQQLNRQRTPMRPEPDGRPFVEPERPRNNDGWFSRFFGNRRR